MVHLFFTIRCKKINEMKGEIFDRLDIEVYYIPIRGSQIWSRGTFFAVYIDKLML